MKWLQNKNVQRAGLAVISAAAGAGVSFLVSAKILEKKFEKRLSEEIAAAKVYYQHMYSTPVFQKEESDDSGADLLERLRTESQAVDGPPEDLVGKALDSVRSYSPSEEDEDGRKQPVVVNNIFTNHTPPGEEVLAALMTDRDPSKPYVITKEEFYENEPDHEQQQFTYWEGDDQLADDRDEFNPIMDIEMVAGEDNLLHFGYGSGDENVVYIRNETLDPPMDLHVTKSSGKYSVEVLAVDDGPHLEHSRGRKFRLSDE